MGTTDYTQQSTWLDVTLANTARGLDTSGSYSAKWEANAQPTITISESAAHYETWLWEIQLLLSSDLGFDVNRAFEVVLTSSVTAYSRTIFSISDTMEFINRAALRFESMPIKLVQNAEPTVLFKTVLALRPGQQILQGDTLKIMHSNSGTEETNNANLTGTMWINVHTSRYYGDDVKRHYQVPTP